MGYRSFALVFLSASLGLVLSVPAVSQSAPGTDIDSLLAAMSRLSITVPMSVAGVDPVRRHLGELGREHCDQQAIADLGNALDKAGYRREAAKAHISFSEACGGYAPSLRAATNILFKLSDFAGASAVASNLIELQPFNDNGYFLRAIARDRGGSPAKAVDDYITAIELFGSKGKISGASYYGLAHSYEKLGQFCDAILAIEAWISLNPTRNDTSQTQAMIADYRKRGNCEVAVGKEETFATTGRNVVRLPVLVNGVRGNFVLDTGATFVSLKNAYAQKAKVQVDQESRLHTANGIADGKRARAATIQVRSLLAKDVPVVVQEDAKATYGDGFDGLLGMSFLSRFKVTIDSQTVRLSGRNPK
jgi:clan AA aspartic protease (TIGR02281 family)